MPRIVLLFEFPTTNGGENSLLAMLDTLTEADAQFLVEPARGANHVAWKFLALAPGIGRLAERLEQSGIEHVGWEPRTDLGVRLPLDEMSNTLLEQLDRLQPDLVHANSLSMARLLGRIAPQLGVPTTGHLRDILKLSSAVIRDLNQLDMLFAVSHATRQFHVTQGLDATRTRVLYNGIRLPAGDLQTADIRHQLGLPPHVRLLLNAGQLGLRKAQDVLLAALPSVLAHVPDVHLVLAGERNSDKQESRDYEQNLRASAASPVMSGHVHFVGFRSDLVALMPQFEILVHAARQEPLGRVLLEAAASGVPIIATNVGGTAEIIRQGESGLLVPPDDPSSMGLAIRQLLDDVNLRQRLATAARRSVEERFAIPHATLELRDAWQALLVGHRD